jgi:RHH-type proline utilization regulon transcriptional repressor/proline dehydrogenase/delta 1-pyrroline-5-carboxylate dehydrogenase
MASILEERTVHWGNRLFDAMASPWRIPLGPAWWEDTAMAMSMADPALKVQLFRFVDALPSLHGAAAIRRHLAEYLGEAKGWRWLAWLARRLPAWGPAGAAVSMVTRWSARRMARRFIVGANRRETLAAVKRLRSEGFASTLDVLGEATLTEGEARGSLEEYLALIGEASEALAGMPANGVLDSDGTVPLPRANVSVKVSALTAVFDPADPEGTMASVTPGLREILRQARDRGAFVHFDMEQHASKDLILELFRRLAGESEFREGPGMGIAIQAYLRETPEDLRSLLEWAQANRRPVTVRLVKGAYWDHETIVAGQMGWPIPVWSRKAESDRQYEELADFLITNRQWLRPAFGSHNGRSLARVLALCEQAGLGPGVVEFQSLFGMGEPVQRALKSLGRRVRVYSPYGELLPGMAYLVRRLLENTANDSFLRQSLAERRERRWLLADPREKAAMNPQKWQPATPSAANGGPPILRATALSDFTRKDVRDDFAVALSAVRPRLGRNYPSFIAGRSRHTDGVIESFNPSRRLELVGTAGAASARDASDAIGALELFQERYGALPAATRAGWLRKAAEIMAKRRMELAAWMVLEVGKGWREADADVAEAIDFCHYYAEMAEWLASPHDRPVAGESNITTRRGRGVAAVIAPWNFPLAIPCGMTAAALAAGCATVLKPAEPSAVVGALLHGIFLEAGVPPEALALAQGPGETVGEALVGHPLTSVIAFTGSLKVGALINERASRLAPGQHHFKRVLAEMGGKNAVIIDDDADMDEAIRSVLAGAFGYQGQKCSACSRLLVPAGMHDAITTRLADAARVLTMGPAENPSFALGPVIDDEARARIEAAIGEGLKRGNEILGMSAGRLTNEGSFVAPAIFTGLTPADPLVRDEIFGPVLAVLPYRDFDEAIHLANDTPFALTAGLHSRSPARIGRFARDARAGNLYVNRKMTGAVVDRQPFGGYGFSGIGAKAGGPDYLQQFMIARTVTENTMRRGFSPETVGP